MRRKLKTTRPGLTKRVKISGRTVYITTGEYEDGTIGEIFICFGKSTATAESSPDSMAIAMSFGLQWGVPLSEFTRKYRHQNADFGGVTSDPEIPMCKSLVDYIAQWLDKRYGGGE